MTTPATAAPTDAPRRGPGRPPLENPRVRLVRYRLTEDEWTRLERAAAGRGQSVTEYARDVALAAARRARV